MKKFLSIMLTGSTLVLAAVMPAMATPSSTYWTPMVMDFQAYLVPHIGIDNYFTVDKTLESGNQGAFPTDVGFTIGVLPFDKFQMEVGIDGLYPSDNPYYFNAKLGSPENAWFSWSPALEVGIFNVGTKTDVTNQNIVYGVIGKTIPFIGRLSAGPYAGNSKVLVDKDGNAANTGYMVAFDHGFCSVKDAGGSSEYNKWVLAADYASGKNALGGGGFGMYYYFTQNISLLTGPVWFNEKAINGDWKWTTQLDINF
jgi:hypothetical protein